MNASEKELLLLWIMITANRYYYPGAVGNTPAVIIAKIAAAFVDAGGPAGWNFPNLTYNVALNLADTAVTSKFEEYTSVIDDFKAAAAGTGWPVAQKPALDHPTVQEIKIALGL